MTVSQYKLRLIRPYYCTNLVIALALIVKKFYNIYGKRLLIFLFEALFGVFCKIT